MRKNYILKLLRSSFLTGGNGEDIGVKDDVVGIEANHIHENVIGAGANLQFTIAVGSLGRKIEKKKVLMIHIFCEMYISH